MVPNSKAAFYDLMFKDYRKDKIKEYQDLFTLEGILTKQKYPSSIVNLCCGIGIFLCMLMAKNLMLFLTLGLLISLQIIHFIVAFISVRDEKNLLGSKFK